MEYAYPAVVFPDQNGYMVIFPDLNDLSVNGEDESGAIRTAKEALQAMLFALKLQGARMPAATDPAKIRPDAVAARLGLPFPPGTGSVQEITINA